MSMAVICITLALIAQARPGDQLISWAIQLQLIAKANHRWDGSSE
jgi:hypothetical protein